MKRTFAILAACLLVACGGDGQPHQHGASRGVASNRGLIDYLSTGASEDAQRIRALERVVFPPDTTFTLLDITDNYDLVEIATQCRNETEFWSVENLSTLSGKDLDALAKIAVRMSTRRVRIENIHDSAMLGITQEKGPTPSPVVEITKEPAVTAEQFTEACKHINSLHQTDRTHAAAHEKQGAVITQALARIDALENTAEEYDEGND